MKNRAKRPDRKRKLRVSLAVLLILVVAAVTLYQIMNQRTFQFYGGIVANADTVEKRIALTFDDGPTGHTGEILETLERLDVKATFFLCGVGMEQCPEELGQIVAAGHGIGNHTYHHRRMVFVSYKFCKDEIEGTDARIRDAGYKGEIYFRPPYFKKLFTLPRYLRDTGRTTVVCTVEPETALGSDATPEALAAYAVSHTEPGDILLLHPMFEPKRVLSAVEQLVTQLKEQGYEFCTVDSLLRSVA